MIQLPSVTLLSNAMGLIIVTAAVLPTVLILWYFYSRDLFPEPKSSLRSAFLRGVGLAVPAVLLELWVQQLLPKGATPLLSAAFGAFMVAALVEESLKLWVLLGLSRKPAFDEPMDGVIYGVTVGLGFATIENLGYALGGLDVALIRAFSAVPGHAAWGAIMGYFVGLASLGMRPSRYIGLGWAIAVLLHGLYDFGPMLLGVMGSNPGLETLAGVASLATLVTLLVGVFWANRLVRSLNREQQALKQFDPAVIVQSAGAEDRV